MNTVLMIKNKPRVLVRINIYIAVIALVSAFIGFAYSMLYPYGNQSYLPEVQAGFSATSANSVTINWTAPGDDSFSGTAVGYDIRYSTQSINDSNWTAASVVSDVPAPLTAGSAESFVVMGLAPNTTYYFAIKTVDNEGLWSALSNIASHTTDCVESWTCSVWSECVNGTQSRTCSDLNNCGTQEEIPYLTNLCTVEIPPTEPPTVPPTVPPVDEPTTPPSGGDEPQIQESYIVAAPNLGGGPQVRIFSKTGKLLSQFYAYSTSFRGGVNVAVDDLDNDGIDEIVVGPGPGYEPKVRVFTWKGRLLYEFTAYQAGYRNGVKVAIGDVDDKGGKEIIVSPASGGGPNIRIFGKRNGTYSPTIENFFAYNQWLRGSWNVASGDLDRDGHSDIITAPGKLTGGPHVRIFHYEGNKIWPHILGFMAYPTNFRGGVNIAAGDLVGNSGDEIITAPVAVGGPFVRIFRRLPDGSIALYRNGFFAYHPEFRGGVSLATGDFNYDGKDEIVTAVQSGDRAVVKIWKGMGEYPLYEVVVFPNEMQAGVNIAVGKFFLPQ
ncbi:MAG: fibronectin type III domain-containing protein [Patescibacteria group bacterium]